MIYTVTFNPALDYVVFLDDLKLGDVNRSTRESIFYGGKGINVSTILNTLGLETTALGFVAGFTGKAIEDGLAAQGIHTDFIHLPEGNSRINVKVKHGDETEINGQGPVITEEAINELFAKLATLTKEDILVLAGSIPNTLPEDIYEKILARLESKGIRVVVDATKDLLLNVLKYHPFLIKPNNHELGEMFGTVCKTDEVGFGCHYLLCLFQSVQTLYIFFAGLHNVAHILVFLGELDITLLVCNHIRVGDEGGNFLKPGYQPF